MADLEHIAILADMSHAAASTRKGSRAVGRYARTPKFEAPSARSSRPNTGQGVTFHFAHKALSKRNDVSDGYGTMTSASAHQGYIERREAGAQLDEKSAIVLDKWSQERNAMTAGTQDQPTEASEKVSPQHSYTAPSFTWSRDRAGFGTLGDSTSERKDFWKKVEMAERKNGRVQSRIIAELPHEASAEERMEIAVNFCKKLDELGLPYWASIHAPTRKNDSRNHHLHIAYSERPAHKNAQGEWDFEQVIKKKKANRNTVAVRPFRQNRSAEVRKRDWVKGLRAHFSVVSNEVLEKGGYEKRLDPRSYKESGVTKEPTRHLGFKAHAMESFGLDTKVGVENAEKETKWRIQSRTQRWERALAAEDVAGLFSGSIDDPDFWAQGTDRRDKIAAGLDVAKLGAESEIMAEQMGLRLGKRMDFLSSEGARLLKRGRGMRIVSVAQDITAIDAERSVLETRDEDVQVVILSLEKQARAARKKEAEIWNEVFSGAGNDRGNALFTNGLDYGDISWDLPAHQAPTPSYKAPLDTVKPALAKKPESEALEASMPGQEKSGAEHTPASQSPHTAPTPRDNQPLVQGQESQPPTANQDNQKEVQTQSELRTPFQKGMEGNKDQGILLIARLTNPEEVKSLDAALVSMTNKEARMRAIATRDLVDVLESGDLRDRANRGWVVLKNEAERRGLDLETGRHLPAKGTDRERAALHRDEYVSTVLELRQELVHVQAR